MVMASSRTVASNPGATTASNSSKPLAALAVNSTWAK
jgi:hypothetical protein